jgi:hypothetical protein
VEDLIKLIACGVVSDMISPSSVSSLFFDAFFGAMTLS